MIPTYWHWVAAATLVLWAAVFRMRLSWRHHVVAFLALGWGAALLSWSVSLEPATGNVSGTVVSARDGHAIARARVYYPGGEKWVRTDNEGRYFLPGVEAGKDVRVSVRARGYDYSYDEITVDEGKETKKVDFRMTPRVATFATYNTERVFTPAEGASMNLSGTMVRHIEVKVYRADPVKDWLAVQSTLSRAAVVERVFEDPPVSEATFTANLDNDDDFSGTVNLGVHEPGLYVARATAPGGRLTRDSWFLVSNLGVVTRRSPSETLFFAQDLKTGKPRRGARLEVFEDDRPRKTLTTGTDGTVTWKDSGMRGLQVRARLGKDWAFSRLDEVYAGDAARARRVFVYTDRPIYRPGHELYFRGLVRRDRNRHYSVPVGESVRVRVRDVQGNPIYDRSLTVDDFGAFSGSVTVPNTSPLGYAYVEAECNRVESRADFQIAEYRKPEFKVDLVPEKKRFDSGDRVRIKVDARYFFGAPVTDAKASYTVYESYYRWSRSQTLDFDSEEMPEQFGGMTAHGNLKFDAEGSAWIEFAPGPSDHDRDFWVEVSVEDPSHRKVTANQSVLVTLGDFYLDTQTDAFGYKAGEKVKVTVDARDYDNHPRAGVPVTARLVLRTYKEVADERGVYSTHVDERDVWSGEARTGKDGSARFDLLPPEEGSYQLFVEAPDDGKTIHDVRWFYVASEGGNFSLSGRDLSLVLDKENYRAGEKARVVISTREPGASVLLCVDGRSIISSRVVQIKGRSATVDIPVEAGWFPNVSVSAVLVRDKRMALVEQDLVVKDADHRLKITIVPDKSAYEPGEVAHLKITATDEKGKPVRAQLSVGVVDVAIYAIAPDNTPDIFDFFYGPESSLVRTEYSFAPDYSGGRSKEEDARVRRNFKDTAYFNPLVTTDAKGQAEVPVPLPDNLTTWRVTVRGITEDTLVGAETAEFLVRKPLLVRLEVPRFIAEQDVMEMAAVVHNETGEAQEVDAVISAQGLNLKAPSTQRQSIPTGGSHRFAWMVEAPSVGEAVVMVRATGQGYADAMELKFPILPHGIEQATAISGMADPTSRATLSVPAEARLEASKLTVYLSPSLAAAAMQGLEYLAAYPYGCTEQTMSAFLPDIQVARALKVLKLSQPELAAKLPDMVATGLARLYDYQHADGGWGWWKDDSTHPYLTAYVVSGLYQAKQAGFEVDAGVYKRGVAALKKLVGEDRGEFRDASGATRQRTLYSARAYMVYVLSMIGEPDAKATADVLAHRKALNPYTTALLAISLWRQGKQGEARGLLSSLQEQADETATTCHWDTKTVDYSWVDDPVEATAAIARAMLDIDPDHPRVEKIMRWLVDYRKGNAWESTKDTGAVISVMTEYLVARKAQLSPNYTATVRVNGTSVADVKVTAPILGDEGTIEVPARLLKAGANEIVVERAGSGALYWSALLRTWPAGEVAADNKGFAVSRGYTLMTVENDANGKPVTKETPIGPDTVIPLGARVKVTVTVKNDKPYSYAMVEDRLPPGFELTAAEADRNAAGYWYVGREVRDDRVSVFITRLEPGTHTLSYEVWAEAPGTFHVRPAVAYLMYTPDVRGNSAEGRVRIAGEDGK
ncbi:MAG: hypothetical protein FJX76_09160 [Armatimonadetes bacterium]|nr:hypothetical protein [Armatimonadota bacterium]